MAKRKERKREVIDFIRLCPKKAFPDIIDKVLRPVPPLLQIACRPVLVVLRPVLVVLSSDELGYKKLSEKV